MWDFVRDREAQAIGYPISQRWTEGPFTLQAFQKVILQWDSGRQRMNYYNTLDALAHRYPWVELPFVPPHQVLEEDQGASFGAIIRNHLAILEHNPAIRERFLSEPDWLNLYGLPIRYEEREVDGNPAGVQLLRTQRTVFVVWSVPAAGVTVGRVNLQNVPDKLKSFSNVVIPDGAKSVAHAPDPTLHAAIRSLPWIADGILPDEQRHLPLLRKLSWSSDRILSTLLVERQADWLQAPLDAEAEGALGILLAFADIPWTRKHIPQARQLLLHMLLHAPRDQWPSPFRKLLHKSWMRDQVTWNELRFADQLLEFAFLWPRHATDPSATHTTITAMLNTMLDMPFLDTFAGYENEIFNHLPRPEGSTDAETGVSRRAGGPDYTLTALHAFAQDGGITDQQALLFLFRSPFKPDVPPEDYAETLNRIYEGLNIRNRDVVTPLSGPVRLFLIHDHDQQIAPNTMDTIERVLNAVIAFTRQPFPNDYLALRVSAREDWGMQGRNNHTYMLINQKYVSHDASSHETQRILAHLIAHYYLLDYSRWIYEGTAVLVEHGVGLRGSALPPEAGHPDFFNDSPVNCPVNSIDAATDDFSSDCQRYLGPRLFLSLYHSLDRESFHNGFANLINAIYGQLYIYCFVEGVSCPYVPRASDVDMVIEAFTSGATPEAAATARRVIGRWYYGDPGALTSP